MIYKGSLSYFIHTMHNLCDRQTPGMRKDIFVKYSFEIRDGLFEIQ